LKQGYLLGEKVTQRSLIKKKNVDKGTPVPQLRLHRGKNRVG